MSATRGSPTRSSAPPSRIYVSAIANGQTTIFALGRDGRKIAIIEVSVGRDVGELSNLLNAAIPGNDIHVRTVADSIILTGSVASAGDAQKAIDIASGFVARRRGSFSIGAAGISASGGSSGKVINSLTIRGLDQVSLRVTVAEIRREIVKQLGVTMSGSGPNGSLKLDNPFAINGALSATEATLNWVKGSGSFSATLQAFERQGVAHTLAEPTVTAVSGESAKFMAGGTIPIANSESCRRVIVDCMIGFIQQPYGVTLNFTPVVLSQGRIQLRIATEVTDVDYANQVTFSGISVPGFRTRNNVTTVELPSGGSIATAGLISTQTQQAINGLPGLMNLPVLGALFRSRDYQRNETELMIVVTPYIVHAIDPASDRQAGPEFRRCERPAGRAARPGQPDLFHVGIASTVARLRREDRIRHSVDASNTMTSIEQLRPARAAGVSGWASALARRSASLGFLAAVSCLQSGCTTDYASSDPAFPGDFQARHPIVLASAPTRMDVYPIGGALDARTVANLRAFAERYREFGSGEIVILTPGRTGSDATAVNEIRKVLARRRFARQDRRRALTSLPSPTAQRRSAWPSWASRRRSERPADCGRRTSLPDRLSKDGRTSHTPISDARPSPSSPPRSTIRAISSSRGLWARPTSPCARGRSRMSARARTRARRGRPTSRPSAGAA